MAHRVLVLYGSYRAARLGIRLARYVVRELSHLGADAELIDAKAIDLPMLDRMYKEYPVGEAPPALEDLAERVRNADAFVFVTGEYNWGVQPGLKNLTDHFLEEWFWRPAAIASYSAGRFSGVRAALAWHGTISEMGMVPISSSLAVGGIGKALDADAQPVGESGAALAKAFPRFAADLAWWAEATECGYALLIQANARTDSLQYNDGGSPRETGPTLQHFFSRRSRPDSAVWQSRCRAGRRLPT